MKHPSIFFVILIVFLTFLDGEHPEFDTRYLQQLVYKLSSKSFYGRESGTLGGDRAALFIIGELKKNGLISERCNHPYRQNFRLKYYHINAARIVVYDGINPRPLSFNHDYFVPRNCGSLNFTGPITYLGRSDFPIHRITQIPVSLNPSLPLIDCRSLSSDPAFLDRLKKRIIRIEKAGYPGCIMTFTPEIRDALADHLQFKFPIILITDLVFNWLISRKNRPSASTQSPLEDGFELSSLIDVRLDTTYDPERKSQNLFATIPGNDPKLKEEILMVGAHYDHLGLNQTQVHHPGADDNASGTAVMLEVLKHLRNEKPKRTVVAAFWGAEEQGLAGSRFFLSNPLFSLNRIIAYLNVDMVGQGDGKIRFRGQKSFFFFTEVIMNRLEDGLKELFIPEISDYGGGDHLPFRHKGIPSFHLKASGIHYNYHSIWDKPEFINTNVLLQATRILYRCILSICDTSRPLKECLHPSGQGSNSVRISPLSNLLME